MPHGQLRRYVVAGHYGFIEEYVCEGCCGVWEVVWRRGEIVEKVLALDLTNTLELESETLTLCGSYLNFEAVLAVISPHLGRCWQ